MILTVRVMPAANQLGLSWHRLSAVFFNNSQDPTFGFTVIQPLPKVLGNGASLTTGVMQLAGFNSFMVLMDVLTNNIAFKLNHINPVDGATVLFTRTIATVPFGTGLNLVTFGYGNAAAQAGQDVFHLVSFTFTNTNGAATATLNQFPGLWGAVRG